MGVKIKIHSKHLTTNRLKQVFEKGALPILAEQIKTDCNTYVRMWDGDLAESATVENGGRDIVWDKEYAQKVYYTGTPSKAKNPKATLRWCEVAERVYSKDWAKLATELVKK